MNHTCPRTFAIAGGAGGGAQAPAAACAGEGNACAATPMVRGPGAAGGEEAAASGGGHVFPSSFDLYACTIFISFTFLWHPFACHIYGVRSCCGRDRQSRRCRRGTRWLCGMATKRTSCLVVFSVLCFVALQPFIVACASMRLLFCRRCGWTTAGWRLMERQSISRRSRSTGRRGPPEQGRGPGVEPRCEPKIFGCNISSAYFARSTCDSEILALFMW